MRTGGSATVIGIEHVVCEFQNFQFDEILTMPLWLFGAFFEPSFCVIVTVTPKFISICQYDPDDYYSFHSNSLIYSVLCALEVIKVDLGHVLVIYKLA
jgi:hypothetical protein